jgi:hypothetical protein
MQPLAKKALASGANRAKSQAASANAPVASGFSGIIVC